MNDRGWFGHSLMRQNLGLHLACAVLVASSATLIGCGVGSDEPAPGPLSRSAVKLPDLDAKPHDLFDGNPQVVAAVFTRTDCPISNRYAPDIGELYERFHSRGVEFYLIYVDPREPADAIRAHLKEFAYPCPALRDPEHTLVAATGATVTPEAVVFDAERRMIYRGRIDDRYAEVGRPRSVATTHELADAIEAALDARPVAEPVVKAVGCNIADLKQ